MAMNPKHWRRIRTFPSQRHAQERFLARKDFMISCRHCHFRFYGDKLPTIHAHFLLLCVYGKIIENILTTFIIRDTLIFSARITCTTTCCCSPCSWSRLLLWLLLEFSFPLFFPPCKIFQNKVASFSDTCKSVNGGHDHFAQSQTNYPQDWHEIWFWPIESHQSSFANFDLNFCNVSLHNWIVREYTRK